MFLLQKQFHNFIYLHRLVEKKEKILLAVSGGIDSMVMCQLFKDEKINFALAHCNFRLRGKESDGDQEHLVAWATQNKVACFVKYFDLNKNHSIQLEARNVRYQWFHELANKHGFHKIATAHHLNDSLETVIMNLARGTGYKGISGIPLMNEKIIRPLLFASKVDLNAYAIKRKIVWREDSGNKKDVYNRNYIRHHVIPKLEKLNPSLLTSFSHTLERLKYGASIISEKVQEIKNKHLIQAEAGGFYLELCWMKRDEDLLIMTEILSDFGVNYATTKEIYAAKGKAGKKFPVKDGDIIMDRNILFFEPLPTLPSFQEIELTKEGIYHLKEGQLRVETIEKDEVVFGNPYQGYFDAKKMKFPLKVRIWKQGDRFQPLGMKGKKKMSDFLIDLKVPLAKKKQIEVITSGNEISWVVGYQISELFKLSEQTKHIIKITKFKN